MTAEPPSSSIFGAHRAPLQILQMAPVDLDALFPRETIVKK